MEAELPLEFPDGTTPVTCPVSIYDGSTDKQVGVGSLMAKGVTPPLLLEAYTWKRCMLRFELFPNKPDIIFVSLFWHTSSALLSSYDIQTKRMFSCPRLLQCPDITSWVQHHIVEADYSCC